MSARNFCAAIVWLVPQTASIRFSTSFCFPTRIAFCLIITRHADRKSKPVYKRIVLKLSGEALQERGGRENISPPIVREIAERMKEVLDLGVQIVDRDRRWQHLARIVREPDAGWIERRPITWACSRL